MRDEYIACVTVLFMCVVAVWWRERSHCRFTLLNTWSWVHHSRTLFPCCHQLLCFMEWLIIQSLMKPGTIEEQKYYIQCLDATLSSPCCIHFFYHRLQLVIGYSVVVISPCSLCLSTLCDFNLFLIALISLNLACPVKTLRWPCNW